MSYVSYDIHFDASVEPSTLQSAIAEVLGVSTADVAVVGDVADLPSQTAALICVLRVTGGEFGTHVSICPQRPGEWPSEEEVARGLCGRLSARALVSDDSMNPYQWVLVTATPPSQAVKLDGEALDERDELTIATR